MTGWIANSLKSLLGALWPPESNEDPTQWRRVVFVTLTLLVLTTTLHLTAAKGFLVGFGFPGFATTAQVYDVEEKANAILYAIYAPQIRAAVRERCDTTDRREREKINQKIDRIKHEYEEASGEEFKPMPSCDEV